LVGATNRPDIIDPALLRPGRLDKALYVPLPDSQGRADILRRLTRRTPLAPGSDPCSLAASRACEGFSGADLASLVREAGVCAIREAVERADREGGGAVSAAAAAVGVGAAGKTRTQPQSQRLVVRDAHFRAALRSVGPSVSKRDVRVYDALRSRLAPKPLLVEEDEEEEGEKEKEKSGGGEK
jgi:ribosome biogenesis ATPase